MNKKYIIGGILIVVFITLALMSFNDSKTEFVTIAQAQSAEEKVQVYGHWLKAEDSYYDSENNQFVFFMEDDNNDSFKVIHSGSKPNNFDIAPKIVVKGTFDNGVFKADQILTKCPSKYEGTAEELKKS